MSFVGLQGCVRYKDDRHPVPQQDYRTLVESLPPADVLVTHCPCGVNDHVALLAWRDRNPPRLLSHGHTYPDAPIATYLGTRIKYVRGARIIDFTGQAR